MDENRSAVYDEPDLELTTISSLIGIIAKKIVILTQYMILAATLLEVSSLLEGRGGGGGSTTPLSIVDLKRKKIGWECHFFSRGDFSWAGGYALPQNSYKPCQDLLIATL